MDSLNKISQLLIQRIQLCNIILLQNDILGVLV